MARSPSLRLPSPFRLMHQLPALPGEEDASLLCADFDAALRKGKVEGSEVLPDTIEVCLAGRVYRLVSH
jgi:hypothetical protein